MAAPAKIVGEILAVPVDQIAVRDRLRPVDPVWAAALGSMMATDGQNTPIEICRLPGKSGFLLVSGLHRLEGARFAAMPTINAIVVDNQALDRRSREVAENLHRKGLGPIDRAAFVAELYAVQKARAGLAADDDAHAAVANSRWQDAVQDQSDDASAKIALAYGWSEGVAEAIGLSRRSIYNDLALHRQLKPDVADILRDLPIGSNASQLRVIAQMEPEQQREAAALIVSGAAKGAADAKAIVKGDAPPDPFQKCLDAALGAITRCPPERLEDLAFRISRTFDARGVTLKLKMGARS